MKYSILFITILVFACRPTPEPFDCTTCPSGVSGYEVVVAESPLDNSPTKQLQAFCPDGKKVLSAGWSVLDSTSAILDGVATYSEPSYDGTHWMVNAKNNSTFSPDWKLRIRCICADIVP